MNPHHHLVRTACHVHSTWSYDGKWPLQDLAKSFSRRGYRAVLMTEHDQGFSESKRLDHRAACQRASDADILLVPGIEYSDPANVIHLLVWGDVPFIGSGSTPEQVLAAVRASGGIAVLAHPSRKEAWKQFNSSWSDTLLGIEFWNRKTDGWAPSRQAWTLLQEAHLLPFAGLDFHDQRQFFPMALFLEIADPVVSEAIVLEALRERHCVSKVLGLSAAALEGGLKARALNSAEVWRRRAAKLYRRLESKFRRESV